MNKLNNENKFERNEKLKGLLKVIALAGGMTALIACPILPIALYPFLKKGEEFSDPQKRKELRRLLASLEKHELVSIEGEKVRITKKGGVAINIDRLEEMIISNKQDWDKYWRLVVFDIPEEERKAREYFRNFLKRSNFHQLQKSVFISPNPCEKEVREVAEILGVWEYISLMRVDKIDKEKKLLEVFHLK